MAPRAEDTCPVCGRRMPRGDRYRLQVLREEEVEPGVDGWWRWSAAGSVMLCRECVADSLKLLREKRRAHAQ